GRAYFQVACEAIFSADRQDLSLLHAAVYAKSNGDLETLISVDQGAQQDRIDGGSARVAEKLSEQLGESVVTNQVVRGIRSGKAGVSVVTRSGQEYRARHVVVTLPPTLAGLLEYEP